MRESIKKKSERAEKIFEVFGKVYDDADCTLEYKTALELLIATQLAAQCTDARVNMVTPALFAKYPDVYAFANADELELREDIRSTGFFRNKAKNIIGCCRMLIDDFGGEVPNNMDDLLKLPGVGRKTANLVLGDFFGIPGVVVELKWGHSPAEALAQMRERDYAAAFRGTPAERRALLCGIAYDPKTKRHTCAIEQA